MFCLKIKFSKIPLTISYIPHIGEEREESGYKYLGVLEGACIKTKEMKDLVKTEYLRRVRLVAGSWLRGGNMIRAVNTWAVSVVRYTAGILEWSKPE